MKDKYYFSGSWKFGEMKRGKGKMKFSDGSVYEGGLLNVAFHGDCILDFSQNISDDILEKDKKSFQEANNKAIFDKTPSQILEEGGYYQGQWKDGLFEGLGTRFYSDKVIYQGEWRAGLYHGYGTLIRPGGHKYSGIWQNGERIGKG